MPHGQLVRVLLIRFNSHAPPPVIEVARTYGARLLLTGVDRVWIATTLERKDGMIKNSTVKYEAIENSDENQFENLATTLALAKEGKNLTNCTYRRRRMNSIAGLQLGQGVRRK